MKNPGYMQGYYIGAFGRFLWLLLIFSSIQSIAIYTFDYNFFTYWVLAIFFSFLINTSIPMGENYNFFRHGLILFSLYFVIHYSSDYILEPLTSFYSPGLIWKITLTVSIVLGITASFGRYSNGTYSKSVETYSNLLLFIFIFINFVSYWWEGGVVYLFIRMLFMIMEAFVARIFLVRLMMTEETVLET